MSDIMLKEHQSMSSLTQSAGNVSVIARFVLVLPSSGFLVCSIGCNRGSSSQYNENVIAVDSPDSDDAVKIDWISQNAVRLLRLLPERTVGRGPSPPDRLS